MSFGCGVLPFELPVCFHVVFFASSAFCIVMLHVDAQLCSHLQICRFGDIVSSGLLAISPAQLFPQPWWLIVLGSMSFSMISGHNTSSTDSVSSVGRIQMSFLLRVVIMLPLHASTGTSIIDVAV